MGDRPAGWPGFHKHVHLLKEMLGMKQQTLYRIAVLGLFLFLGGLLVPAQSMEKMMTVQVPFDFQVNEKLLPAGEYVIKRDPQVPRLLLIQCPQRKISVGVYTIPLSLSKPLTRASLTFTDYGEKRFLSEVKILSRDLGYELIKSKAEQRLAQLAEVKTIHAIPKSTPANN
jgi:hypothetical protein